MKIPRPLPLKSLHKRVWLSFSSLVKLLYFKPAYFFLAAGVSILFYEFIFWFLNLGLMQYLLTSPFLTVGDKIQMLIGSYSGIFTLPLSPLALTLFAVSVFQGVAVAALVYSIRKERAMQRGFLKEFGGTGIAGALSVLGLGCAACGTSLVTPILTFFFATSSVAVAEEVGLYSAVLALIVSLITVYLTGLKLAPRLKVQSS
ncbi:hypothetical protein KA021_00400 [Candidatus Saccharibacteria bacterium]|nr:hypothetical protein [Candidatus Saccharibacteria bacterium]OYW43896.1 MAG: hypothetical protein B7Z28_00465 [Candidatus Saccharibacteria bacterium 32-45-3]